MDNNTSSESKASQLPRLTSVGQLLANAWQIFKNLFLKIIVVYLIPTFIINAIFIGLASKFGLFSPVEPGISTISLVLFILAFFIPYFLALGVINIVLALATLFLIKERDNLAPTFWTNIKNVYKFAWHKFWSFIWANFLVGMITIAGAILFIVPGAIFSIWFALTPFVVVFEDKKGIKALQHSRELIKNYWLPVIGRSVIVGLLGFLLVPIRFIFLLTPFIGGILNSLVTILFALFATINAVLIYENLKSIKGPINIENKKKTWYIVGAIIGPIAILIIIIFSLFIIKSTINNIMPGIQRPNNATSSQESDSFGKVSYAIVQFCRDNAKYPELLTELQPKYLPQDFLLDSKHSYQKNGAGFEYSMTYSNGESDRSYSEQCYIPQ